MTNAVRGRANGVMLGRDELLRQVLATASPTTGGPRVVVLEGEPGIGKTRLWARFRLTSPSRTSLLRRVSHRHGQATWSVWCAR
jgi:hypothetical protein